MVASNEVIARLALDRIGNATTITTLATDTSEAAAVINRWLATVKEEMLKEAPWTFARKVAALTGEADDPNDLWAKSYTYPTDCVTPLFIMDTYRVPDPSSPPIPFDVGLNSGGTANLIWTDEDDASLCYTSNVAVTVYPDKFTRALVLKLAIYCLPRLGRGDPYSMLPGLWQEFYQALSEAKAEDANRVRRDPPGDAELITGRG